MLMIYHAGASPTFNHVSPPLRRDSRLSMPRVRLVTGSVSRSLLISCWRLFKATFKMRSEIAYGVDKFLSKTTDHNFLTKFHSIFLFKSLFGDISCLQARKLPQGTHISSHLTSFIRTRQGWKQLSSLNHFPIKMAALADTTKSSSLQQVSGIKRRCCFDVN